MRFYTRENDIWQCFYQLFLSLAQKWLSYIGLDRFFLAGKSIKSLIIHYSKMVVKMVLLVAIPISEVYEADIL